MDTVAHRKPVLNEMPDKILVEIFKWVQGTMEHKKFLSLPLVCKRWKELIDSYLKFEANTFFSKSNSATQDMYDQVAQSIRLFRILKVTVESNWNALESNETSYNAMVNMNKLSVEQIILEFYNARSKLTISKILSLQSFENLTSINITTNDKYFLKIPEYLQDMSIVCNNVLELIINSQYSHFTRLLRLLYLPKIVTFMIDLDDDDISSNRPIAAFWSFVGIHSNTLEEVYISFDEANQYEFIFSRDREHLTMHYCGGTASSINNFLTDRRLACIRSVSFQREEYDDAEDEFLDEYFYKLKDNIEEVSLHEKVAQNLNFTLNNVRHLELQIIAASTDFYNHLSTIFPNTESIHMKFKNFAILPTNEKLHETFRLLRTIDYISEMRPAMYSNPSSHSSEVEEMVDSNSSSESEIQEMTDNNSSSELQEMNDTEDSMSVELIESDGSPNSSENLEDGVNLLPEENVYNDNDVSFYSASGTDNDEHDDDL